MFYMCVETDFVDFEFLRFHDFLADEVGDGLTFVSSPGVILYG